MVIRIQWLHTWSNVDMIQVSKTENCNKPIDCLRGTYSVYKDITSAVPGWGEKKDKEVTSWVHYCS